MKKHAKGARPPGSRSLHVSVPSTPSGACHFAVNNTGVHLLDVVTEGRGTLAPDRYYAVGDVARSLVGARVHR